MARSSAPARTREPRAARKAGRLRWWQSREHGLPDEAAVARARADSNPNVRLILVRIAMSDVERGPELLRSIAETDEDAYVRLFARQRMQ